MNVKVGPKQKVKETQESIVCFCGCSKQLEMSMLRETKLVSHADSSLNVGVGLCSMLLVETGLLKIGHFGTLSLLYLCGGRALWQGTSFVILIDFIIIIIASLRVVLAS